MERGKLSILTKILLSIDFLLIIFWVAYFTEWEIHNIFVAILFVGMLRIVVHKIPLVDMVAVNMIMLPVILPTSYLLGPLLGSLIGVFGTFFVKRLRTESLDDFLLERALVFLAVFVASLWFFFGGDNIFRWSDILVVGLAYLTFFAIYDLVSVIKLQNQGLKNNRTLLLLPGERLKGVIFSAMFAAAFIIVYNTYDFKGAAILFALMYFAKEIMLAQQNLKDNFFQVIESFAKFIDAKDSYTRGHSERVASYCNDIAARINMAPLKIERLVQVAKLHDIGKIGIPDSIIKKKGRLTAKEFASIKKHPELGAQLLSNIGMLRDFVPIIRHHHERYNGSGYPEGLVGDEISLEARILALADAFDCMTTDRVYRDSLPKEDVVAELSYYAGSQFDPTLAEILIEMINEGCYDRCFK